MEKLDPQHETVDFQLALTLSKRIIFSCTTYIFIHYLYLNMSAIFLNMNGTQQKSYN